MIRLDDCNRKVSISFAKRARACSCSLFECMGTSNRLFITREIRLATFRRHYFSSLPRGEGYEPLLPLYRLTSFQLQTLKREALRVARARFAGTLEQAEMYETKAVRDATEQLNIAVQTRHGNKILLFL